MSPTRLAASAAAACALLAACVQSQTDPAVSLRTVAVPRDTLAPGDSLRLTTWVVNPEDEPLRLEFEDQCQVELYVTAPDRTVVHPPGGGATCISTPTTLQVPARDSVRFDDVWLAGAPSDGQFSAYGVLSQHHVARGDRRDLKLGHRSNVILFRVVAPKP